MGGWRSGAALALATVLAVAGVTGGETTSASAAVQGGLTITRLTAFPVAGGCFYSDTWGAPRSGGRRHEGVDIIANEGTPLVAVTAGRITKIVRDTPGSLGGNYFRLTAADGTYFTYIHLSRFASGLSVGNQVRAGQTLGYVGRTGQTSVSHLHFEVHPWGGPAVNPTSWVNAVGGCRSRPTSGGGATPPPTPTPNPPSTGLTKTFAPAAVVFDGKSFVSKRTPTGIQVVGFPGMPSSSKVVQLTVTLTGTTSGKASIWPCGTNAGLAGGTKLTMTWPGAATSSVVKIAPGDGGRVCLEAESDVKIKVAVNGLG